MDQDASAAVEELEARFRLDHEQRSRLQAQDEERLQQATSTYERNRVANQEEIKQKELVLQELEAKYNEGLEAWQTALQRDTDCKRKHEAEVQQLNRRISRLKRLKTSNEEFLVRLLLFFHHQPQSRITAPFQTKGT